MLEKIARPKTLHDVDGEPGQALLSVLRVEEHLNQISSPQLLIERTGSSLTVMQTHVLFTLIFAFPPIAYFLYWVHLLQRFVKEARLTGLPYVVAPFWLFSPLWAMLQPLLLPILTHLPEPWSQSWLPYALCYQNFAEWSFADSLRYAKPSFDRSGLAHGLHPIC